MMGSDWLGYIDRRGVLFFFLFVFSHILHLFWILHGAPLSVGVFLFSSSFHHSEVLSVVSYTFLIILSYLLPLFYSFIFRTLLSFPSHAHRILLIIIFTSS
ncbi:unnamed protein product, partial [Tuber aestivum]